jgi:adenosylcobinamide-GDP ribazoletransferase
VTRSFVIAWHFLTAIPLTAAHHDPASRELAQSMAWFPLVGLILGGLLAAAALVFSTIFSDGIVNVLLIVVLAIVTRGLHLDGLADSLDGLAGGRTPTDRLAIMHDGRIGAIGATGLILALGLRYAGLAALPLADRLSWLISMPAVGRWAMVVGAMSANNARTDGGLAQPFLEQLSLRELISATVLLSGTVILAIGPLSALVACGLVALVARAITALARRLLGGITGDVLGATNEIAEVVFLILAPAVVDLGLPFHFSR